MKPELWPHLAAWLLDDPDCGLIQFMVEGSETRAAITQLADLFRNPAASQVADWEAAENLLDSAAAVDKPPDNGKVDLSISAARWAIAAQLSTEGGLSWHNCVWKALTWATYAHGRKAGSDKSLAYMEAYAHARTQQLHKLWDLLLQL